MKIAINGEIIDTEYIYKFGNIKTNTKSHLDHTFHIQLMNHEYMYFTESSGCYISNKYTSITRLDYSKDDMFNGERNLIDLQNSKEYISSLLKITKFRQSIIDIWSNNQSTIPQFNL